MEKKELVDFSIYISKNNSTITIKTQLNVFVDFMKRNIHILVENLSVTQIIHKENGVVIIAKDTEKCVIDKAIYLFSESIIDDYLEPLERLIP